MMNLLTPDQLPSSFVNSVREQSRAEGERAAQNEVLATEWKRRAGIFTASQLYKLITPTLKKPENATYRQYIAEKAWERMTGCAVENASGAVQTQWGKEFEAEALFEFTISTGIAVEQGGIWQKFFKREDYPFGATPDGIISDALSNRTHVVEVKCPYNGGIHLQNVCYGSDPEWFRANRFEYWAQVQGAMWAADVERCYFISYDPGVSRERDSFERVMFEGFKKKLFWTEFELDQVFVEAIKAAIERAESDLLRMI